MPEYNLLTYSVRIGAAARARVREGSTSDGMGGELLGLTKGVFDRLGDFGGDLIGHHILLQLLTPSEALKSHTNNRAVSICGDEAKGTEVDQKKRERLTTRARMRVRVRMRARMRVRMKARAEGNTF